MSTVPSDLVTLCEKEFKLERDAAYSDLDREIVAIKHRMASTGNLLSSNMARAVVDAVLARFDRALAAFEGAYLDKWALTDRALSNEDYEWLKAKVAEKIDYEITEVRTRCGSALWNERGTFLAFSQGAEPEARKRRNVLYEKIDILRLKKGQGEHAAAQFQNFPAEPTAAWKLIHPTITKVAKRRYESGLFADAVEAAFKEVNDIVRRIVKDRAGQELDGADLMNKAFSANNPIIVLDDMTTTTGKNIQQGYMLIFAGSMIGIRNPKAHANIEIDAPRAIHFLFLASLLLFKIDEKTK
jgi:uncharacterized protein (TIGR02391 family)